MPASSYAKLSILVADPNQHMADLIAVMLRSLGIRQIRSASDTSAAFSLLRLHRFDALMVDEGIEGAGGIDLTRRLRLSEGDPNQQIPVIMMSVEPLAATIAAARDAGISEFLRKPFSAEHIASRLNSIFSAPREFVSGGSYVGPDRRRRVGSYTGKDRRGTD